MLPFAPSIPSADRSDDFAVSCAATALLPRDFLPAANSRFVSGAAASAWKEIIVCFAGAVLFFVRSSISNSRLCEK